MIDIPMRTKGSIDRNSLSSLNQGNQNRQSPPPQMPKDQNQHTAQHDTPVRSTPKIHRIPAFTKPVQKGQKFPIGAVGSIHAVNACFGWNTTNPQCDVDVSAFLLGNDGKVLGDSWFVFYGQTKSPDNSAVFYEKASEDCEMITLDLQRLNPNVKKIVFVLTIHDAFEKKLHFGMMKDAYVRILNKEDGTEFVSFQMTDYYSNIISMMIGELYNHNGTWKFNAIGNGVARDLAGLCSLYGVQVIE